MACAEDSFSKVIAFLLPKDEYPKFELDSSRFDLNTFFGRFKHCCDLIDPRSLLTSEEDLCHSLSLLNAYELGFVKDFSDRSQTNEKLWRAQKIKDAIIHPDTSGKIFLPFRMSGFVVFGAPIVSALVYPWKSVYTTLFWHWVNQSHNAGVNYANRNASSPTQTNFIMAYFLATTTAVSLCAGLRHILKKQPKLSHKFWSYALCNYAGVACANVSNLYFMRRSEKVNGVVVFSKSGVPISNSVIAAKKAITLSAFTRTILPLPILLLPPVAMKISSKLFPSVLKKSKKAFFLLQTAFCVLAFSLALPLSLALFPQRMGIAKDLLEKEVQLKTDESILYFNRGL